MIRSRRFVPAGLLAIVLGACAGARSQAAVEEDTEAFYAAFAEEVRESVRSLGTDGREQLLDIMPVAEVEGATRGVLEVIETRPALRPFVRRIRRFLDNQPSNWVRRELATENGDRRLWHILLDSINGELGRPSSLKRSGSPIHSLVSGSFFPRPWHAAGHIIHCFLATIEGNRNAVYRV